MILEAFKRQAYRRQVLSCLSALVYPSRVPDLGRSLKERLDYFTAEGIFKRWSPETVAAIVMTLVLEKLIRDDLTPAQRMIYLENLRSFSPKDFVQELEWITWLVNSTGYVDSFIFRYNFANGMLASWLIRSKTIDIFTKSLFVSVTAQALAGVDCQTSDETFSDLVGRIGKAST